MNVVVVWHINNHYLYQLVLMMMEYDIYAQEVVVYYQLNVNMNNLKDCDDGEDDDAADDFQLQPDDDLMMMGKFVQLLIFDHHRNGYVAPVLNLAMKVGRYLLLLLLLQKDGNLK